MEEIEVLKKALEKEKSERVKAEKIISERTQELSDANAELRRLNQSLEEKIAKRTAMLEQQASHLLSASTRLSSLIENFNSAVLLEDEERKILLVNQLFCSLFSIPVDPHLLTGVDCSQSAAQSQHLFKEPELFTQRISQLLAAKKPVLNEVLEMVDGKVLKRNFIPIFKDEDYLGHLWTYEDITAQSIVQKKIEALSRFPEECPNPILRCNLHGEIMYANHAGKPLTSVLTAYKYVDKYKPIQKKITEQISAVYTSGKPVTLEICIGKRFYELTIVPVAEQKYINIYGTDITERKSAEQKIHLLKELMDQYDDFIQVLDEEGNFIFANEASSKRFSLSKDQMLKTNIKDIVPAFYQGMTWEEQFSFFRENKNVTIESHHTRKDNTRYPIEANVKYIEVSNKRYIISFSRDITERQSASEQLQRQKEFYENILNNIPSDIAVFNDKHEYLFVNPVGIKDEMLRKWIIGKTDFDYCRYRGKDESIALERKEKHDMVLTTKKPIEWEDRIIDAEGNAVYQLRRFKPVLDANGEVKILIGYGLNITEMKRIQEELAKSEERYRLVIESTNDGIWDWDIPTGNVYLSPRWKEMLGYEAHELENNIAAWHRTMVPEDLEMAAQILKEHLQQHKPYQYKLRSYHKDGSIRWIMCRGFALRDQQGTAYRMVGTCTDITETKMAEEQLKASEEKLHAIFNNSFDAKFLVNPVTNRIIDCNQRTLELFDIACKEDLIGSFGSDLQKEPFDKDNAEKIRQEFVANGYWSREIEYVSKKGRIFWGNLVAKIIQINNKDVNLIRIDDITERKHIEQELLKAKTAAEESTKAKEIFLANMSHEIRTPMNGIIGMADILQQTSLDPEQQQYLKVISNSADNLLIIINDILDIAKIESGKLTIEKVPFDIMETVKNTVQTLIYKAEGKGIHLSIHQERAFHNIVEGDPYRLTQILLNLVNNAIKFTENGYVEVLCRVPQETSEEITYEFIVKDSGIGIPANKLDTIFEGFTQAHSGAERKYEGTGLGLTICKNLIEMQGGMIWVESKVNEGSRFIFTLTYQKGHHLNNEAPLSGVIDYKSLGRLKVLLAEDNEVNQFMAKIIIHGWGFDLDIADNGIKAIELAQAHHYDIILMDIQMPEMGGMEATQKIRSLSDPAKASVPIVALTANALAGDAEKYMASGMNDYLSKPFQKENLFRKISENIRPGTEITIPDSGHDAESSEDTALINMGYLREHFDNNEEFIRKIVGIFISTTPAAVADLKKHLETRDYEGLQASAHKLKTTIDSFKITRLQQVIREIESNASTVSHVDQLPLLVSYVSEILEKAVEEVQKKWNLG